MIEGNVRYIFQTGALMLGITLVLGVVAIVAVYWASRVSMGVGADARATVYGRVQGFSAGEMNHFGTPSLITRNTNDVQQIQLFLQIVRAENLVHGSGQQSCSPCRLAVMITSHVPAVHVPPDHAANGVAAARPA